MRTRATVLGCRNVVSPYVPDLLLSSETEVAVDAVVVILCGRKTILPYKIQAVDVIPCVVKTMVRKLKIVKLVNKSHISTLPIQEINMYTFYTQISCLYNDTRQRKIQSRRHTMETFFTLMQRNYQNVMRKNWITKKI